MLVFLAVNNC